MKLLSILRKGAVKSALSYKLLITMWIITLVMILFVAMPLKLGLKMIFSKSFAADRLLNGFDIGLTGDMGPAFGNLLASATYGGFLLLIAGFLLYTFFAGGLFARFTTAYGSFKVSSFLKSSAHNFITYLGIGIIMFLVIVVWAVVIIGIPAGITSAVTDDPLSVITVSKVMVYIWALGLPLWFLVADHSRIWVASTGTRKVFKALGAGFASLRVRFITSYLAVLIIFIVNLIFLWLIITFTASSIPEKGLWIFLFFIATQVMFILRLFLKVWRYATVSELALPSGEGQ
ncbi:MAG TPA: hypothetical protein VMV74_01190 [Bacteroidales bacterium]|nr:hypothetical protein [Bacteroidales bacterium]